MAYEYFLQAYLNQKPQSIPRDTIFLLLTKYISKEGENFVDIRFDANNHCTVYVDTTSEYIGSLTFSRPSSVLQLSELIYQLMLAGNFIFFEPDGKYPIALSANVEHHLPPDMIEGLGQPKIATTKEMFFKLLAEAR